MKVNFHVNFRYEYFFGRVSKPNAEFEQHHFDIGLVMISNQFDFHAID